MYVSNLQNRFPVKAYMNIILLKSLPWYVPINEGTVTN